MSKKKNRVVPMTPVEQFLGERTCKNLTLLVAYLAKGNRGLGPAQRQLLAGAAEQPVIAGSLSLDDFDIEIWRSLGRFERLIDWGMLVHKAQEESQGQEGAALHEAAPSISKAALLSDETAKLITETISADLELQSSRDQVKADLYQPLAFFAEVDAQLMSRNIKLVNPDLTRELSGLLLDLARRQSAGAAKTEFESSDWDWLLLTLSSAYASYLRPESGYEADPTEPNSDVDPDHETAETDAAPLSRVADELIALASVCSLSLLAIPCLQDGSNFFKSTSKIFARLEVLAVDPREVSAFEESTAIFREKVEGRIPIGVTKLMKGLCEGYMSRFGLVDVLWSHTVNVMMDAYLGDAWADLFMNDLAMHSELVVDPVELLFQGLLFDAAQNLGLQGRQSQPSRFKVDINSATLMHSIKARRKTGPSPYAMRKFLRETPFIWENGSSVTYGLSLVLAQALVEHLKSSYAASGVPDKIDLIAHTDSPNLSYCFPFYYECLSTLAIPLAIEESEETHFFGSRLLERYITAADLILEAGLPRHALTFLGCGLLRLHGGLTGSSEQISPRPIDAFIRQDRVWPYVETHLLHALNIIASEPRNLPLITSIWLKDIQKTFKKGELVAIDFRESKKEEAAEPDLLEEEVKLPAWFQNDLDTDSLKAALEAVRRALYKSTIIGPVSSTAWQQRYLNNALRGKLLEITNSLEDKVLSDFSEVIEELTRGVDSDSFLRFIEGGARDGSRGRDTDAPMLMGTICHYLHKIHAAQSKRKSDWEALARRVTGRRPEWKMVLQRLGSLHRSDVAALDRFRELRNLISHPRHQSNASRLTCPHPAVPA